MKKKIVLGFVALCLILLMLMGISCVYVREGKSGPLAGFAYTVNPFSRSVMLIRYTGNESDVIIPGQVHILGIPMRTELVSQTLLCGNEHIVSVTFEPGAQLFLGSMHGLFEGCTALEYACLSGLDTRGVTDMARAFRNCRSLRHADMTGMDTAAVETMYAMFSGCSALERIDGYAQFDTGALKVMSFAFSDVRRLDRIDLSAWDLDQLEAGAWCFQNCRAREIRLPDNLAVISAGFMDHASSVEGEEFAIPAGVKAIGFAHTFYDFAGEDFVRFAVPQENSAYRVIDGALYTADGTALLAVPRGMTFENGVFALPEGVTFLPELCFSRNRHFHTLLLPDSYVIRQHVPLHDPQYILPGDGGNINAGNSLSIALYMYTAVTDYAVKGSNPRYRSADGVIYSCDMREIIAVPARYDRWLEIPVGVTAWRESAMWAEGPASVDRLMENCPGVSIPASMTEIAQDQIDMLNRLRRKRYHEAFEIDVHPDNPAFEIDGDGYLRRLDARQIRNKAKKEREHLLTFFFVLFSDNQFAIGHPAKPDMTAGTCTISARRGRSRSPSSER